MNQDGIQKINRSLIMKILLACGGCSRATLSRMSGLRPATITNIINELKEARLVREEGVVHASRGRNGIAVSLDTSFYRVVGVRLTRKYFLVGMFDLSGAEREVNSFKIESDEAPHEVLEHVCECIAEALRRNADLKTVAIGCAVPGPFLRRNGKTAFGAEFPDWTGIGIQKTLEERFGLPAYLEHDANAGALAYHWKFGLDQDKMLIYFSAGQGIGGGIVHRGRLILGALGAAGEVGHMTVEKDGVLCKCGNRGCLERYCSSTVLTDKVNLQLRNGSYSMLAPQSNFSQIQDAVRAGDKLAVQEFEHACDYLGVGVVNIVNILNPDIVVIGDELADIMPDVMKQRILNTLQSRIYPAITENMEVFVESEKTDMILKGGAIVAIENLMKEPAAFMAE